MKEPTNGKHDHIGRWVFLTALLCPLYLILLLAAYWFFVEDWLHGPVVVTHDLYASTARGEPKGQYSTQDKFHFVWSFTRLRDCPTRWTHNITDGQGVEHRLGQHEARSTIPRSAKMLLSFKLPDNATPGPSSWFATGEHRCNPLRTKTERYGPIQFEIME